MAKHSINTQIMSVRFSLCDFQQSSLWLSFIFERIILKVEKMVLMARNNLEQTQKAVSASTKNKYKKERFC